MAFFGIIMVMWLFILILIVIACAILFVFIPCLVLSIISLVKGIKTGWPMWSRVLLGITGTIVTIFFILFTWYLVWRFCYYVPPTYDESSTSEMSNLLLYLSLL